MSKPVSPVPGGFREWFLVAIAWIVAFDAAFLWQRLAGAHTSEFGGNPEESSHYVTGLMVRDYVTNGFPADPAGFAETYKAHYPNIAPVATPPILYAVQAAWTLIFGIGRTSLMLLMCGVAAVLAALLFRVVRVEFGIALGFASLIIFVCIPLVREYYSTIMPEMLAAIFMFSAAINFGRFLDEERTSRAITFGVLAGLSILTQRTALALALLVPIAILVSGKFRVLASPAFWGGIALTALIAGPWAWHFRGRGSNGPDAQDFAASSHLPLEAFPFYLGRLGLALGIALALLFCVGLAARLGKRSARRGVWAALAGLIAAGVLFHSLANGGLEERHLVFVLPAAITFAVAGAVVVQEWLSLRWSRAAIAGFPAVSAVLLLVAIISQEIITRALNLSPSKHWSGYGKLANELLSDAHGKEQAIMISSDPTGEGVFTAELAMREKRPGHIVKLASRDLARRDTLRGDPRPRFETEDDVATWFAKAGIDYLLIDESVPEELRTQHHDQLMRAVDAHSDRFWPMARQIITRDGQIHSSRTTLYRVKHVE